MLRMPKYKHGKQTDTIELKFLTDRMNRGVFKQPLRDKSFLALLYWTGVRKSEAYERVKEDFIVTETDLVIDFHQRKKNGLEVPPLEIPLDLPYMNLILERVQKTRQGRRVWPLSSATAWRIVKRALGEKYYPHFLRLNRITRMFDDPTTTIPEAKSWTGIKTAKALDVYIGFSKRRMEKGKERLRREVITESSH
jgi:integrase